jgi:hypothetical protein
MDRKEIDSMRRLMLSIVLLLPLLAHAEHLFEMGVHGGVAAWSSQPVYVQSQMGLNGGAHLYYNYLSPYVIGFRIGLSCDYHQAGFRKINYEDHYSTIDVENQQMEVDYLIGNLSERYTTWSIGVPVQLAFSAKNVLFLAGIAFPLTNSWKQSAENAALSVFYPAYDNRVYEAYPLAASRNFAMYNEGRLALPKVLWWATAELSYKIPINKNSRTHNSYIVVGVYGDYCLSKYAPARSDAVSMIMLTDTRDGFPLQRILMPVMEANRQGQKLVSQMALFDVGIKISYAISPYDASSQPKTTPCRCLGVWK